MALKSISNRRGFFSDYWLGTLASARSRDSARLTPAQARRMLERLRRMLDMVNGAEATDLTTFRERFARPLLDEILGFTLEEQAQEPRLRPLKAREANGSVLAAAYLLPEAEGLDAPRIRRTLDEGLVQWGADYGFVLTPEILRLVRRSSLGTRGAALEVRLPSLVDQEDSESLIVLHQLLFAQNFVRGAEGTRLIDRLEEESGRHSAKVPKI